MQTGTIRSTLLLLLVFLLLSPAALLAETCAGNAPGLVWGAKRYDKPNKNSVTFQEAIPLTLPLPAPLPPPALPTAYLIEIKTDPAALSGKNVVTVKLNGQLMADTTSLKSSNPLTRTMTAPLAVNQLEIVMQGSATNFVEIRILCQSCVRLQVDTPLNDATVEDPIVTISGTVAGIFRPDLLIMANGFAAPILGNRFSVNGIPLVPGENRFCVMAQGPQGVVDSAVHRLYYYPRVDRSVDLSATPDYGLAPFTTVFHPEYVNITPLTSSLQCQGPETVATTPNGSDYTAIFPTPGIYTCQLDVTHSDGTHYLDSVDITALSKNEMDARLVEKWGDLKTALTGGNIDQAVDTFALGTREVFRAQFTSLTDYLSQIGQDLQSIRLVEMSNERAIYDLRKVYNGTEYSFQVEFVRDEDGFWRLWTF